MKRSIIIALAATVALAPIARAAEDPHPGAHDPRIRWVAYDAINVVKVVATDLRSTMIQFASDETVNIVAIGDQKAWTWQKARNLLFLKPAVSPGRQSNMQVVTVLKDGQQRVYQFELDPAADDDQPVFSINFTYPGDAAAARRRAAAERAAKAQADMARQRLEVDYFYGQRNWKYVARGSVAIQPSTVSDNGETTEFRFPGNTQEPAVYQIAPDGKEQLATVTMRGDIAVAHGTAHAWRLRLGKEVCDIWNMNYDPVGQNPRTGTTSPEVARTVKGGRNE